MCNVKKKISSYVTITADNFVQYAIVGKIAVVKKIRVSLLPLSAGRGRED